MKRERMNGYIHLAEGQPPLLVYVRSLVAVAVTVAVGGEPAAGPPERRAALARAVGHKRPGLYRATVTLDPGAPAQPAPGTRRVRWAVTCGRRLPRGAGAEVLALTQRVQRRPAGAAPTRAALRRVREARAMVDGLRRYVLAAGTVPTSTEVTS